MKIEVLSLHNNSRDYARHEPISWPMLKIVRRQQKRSVENTEKLDETRN